MNGRASKINAAVAARAAAMRAVAPTYRRGILTSSAEDEIVRVTGHLSKSLKREWVRTPAPRKRAFFARVRRTTLQDLRSSSAKR